MVHITIATRMYTAFRLRFNDSCLANESRAQHTITLGMVKADTRQENNVSTFAGQHEIIHVSTQSALLDIVISRN